MTGSLYQSGRPERPIQRPVYSELKKQKVRVAIDPLPVDLERHFFKGRSYIIDPHTKHGTCQPKPDV